MTHGGLTHTKSLNITITHHIPKREREGIKTQMKERKKKDKTNK